MSQCLTLSLLSASVLLLPAGAITQQPPADTVVAEGLVRLELGDGFVLVPRKALLRWQADSLPLPALMAGMIPRSTVRCPMPVSVPTPGRTAPMPIAMPDSLAAIPMPTDTTGCFNPLYRQR
jgi:hypothetical protein